MGDPRHTADVRSRGGFTLLEVLVALVVASLALAAAVQATTGHARALHHMHRITLAGWVGDNVVTRWRLERRWPEPGHYRGVESMAGTEWRWEAAVAATPDPTVRRMTVTVRRNGSAPPGVVTGYLGQP